MKKILIGILLVTFTMLYSCARTTVKSNSGDSQKVDITTSSYAVSDDSSGDVPGIADKSFIGVWSTDELMTNQILIYEITENSLRFNSGVNSLFGFDATAVILDGEIVFGDGISPDYSGPDGVKGKLEFSDNSITVTYTDFGSLEYSEYYPNTYTFTIKDKNSDIIISQYKASLPN